MKELLIQYRHTIFFTIIGMIIVTMIFTIGFWKSLFAIIIIGIFVFIGYSMDRGVNIRGNMEEIWNKKDWR